MMKKSAKALLIVIGLTFSLPAFSGEEDEINRFETMCKTDADIVVNGYQFKKSNLPFGSIVNTIKQTFAKNNKAAKSSGDDVLYLIDAAYTLNPDLNEDIIREAAYRLCMKEKLSTDLS